MHACEAVCLTGSLNMHVDNKYCNKGYVAPLPSNCFEVVFYVYSVSALTVGTHTRLNMTHRICSVNTDAQWFFIHNSGV